MAFIICLSVFANSPFKITAKANVTPEIFAVKTDGYSCNGFITYVVSLKNGVAISGVVLRFKYDPAVLEVADCDAYMKTDSYGDEYQNIPGLYVDGDVANTNGEYALSYVYMGDDYLVKNADKEFIQITFKLKDNVFTPFSKTNVEALSIG